MLAGVADYGRWTPVARFVLATVALAGLAWVVSLSTEQLSEHSGPAVTGVLQSTLANLPEVFVVIFALQHGELLVAQTALVGSIFGNGLLVLGLVLVAGARHSRDGLMRFSRRLPNDAALLLLLLTFVLVLVALTRVGHERAGGHATAISAVAAGLLLAVYARWVVPYVRAEARAGRPARGAERGQGRISLPAAIVLLSIGAGGSAFVSDWFIDALAPAVRTLGLSQAFAGLVIVGIAGNTVEYAGGVVLAIRGRSDHAIALVKNSVSQIAVFVFPLLVLISFALSTTLTFALHPVYVGALLLTALALWQVTGDGEAAEFEGWALIALYAILATVAQFE